MLLEIAQYFKNKRHTLRKMRTVLTDINGNPNVGVFIFATDNYVIVGSEIEKSKKRIIEDVLGIKPLEVTISGTSLPGVFLVGHNKKLLVPSIAYDTEIDKIKKELEKKGIEIGIFDTTLTALSNNILLGEEIAIISPEYSKKEAEFIAKFFEVKVKKMPLGKTHVPGSLIIINGKKAGVSNLLSEEEERFIGEELNVETNRISVNMGNPFIKSGIVINKNGLIIGNNTGGAEAAIIEQALRGD